METPLFQFRHRFNSGTLPCTPSLSEQRRGTARKACARIKVKRETLAKSAQMQDNPSFRIGIPGSASEFQVLHRNSSFRIGIPGFASEFQLSHRNPSFCIGIPAFASEFQLSHRNSRFCIGIPGFASESQVLHRNSSFRMGDVLGGNRKNSAKNLLDSCSVKV